MLYWELYPLEFLEQYFFYLQGRFQEQRGLQYLALGYYINSIYGRDSSEDSSKRVCYYYI